METDMKDTCIRLFAAVKNTLEENLNEEGLMLLMVSEFSVHSYLVPLFLGP